jgi:DUF438 domain-containing protein
MNGLSGKKELLKELIRRLHQGENQEEIKEKFKEMFKNVTPQEIAKIEEELIKEGMPAEEIHRFCDVHIAMFREGLEKEKTIAPPGHPIHILMEEHKILLKFAEEFAEVAKSIKTEKDSSTTYAKTKKLGNIEGHIEKIRHLGQITDHFKDSESHYLREENVLFPYLEKHGITQPPAIMWMEHDQIREMKKNIYKILDSHDSMILQDFADRLHEEATALAEMLAGHFYKENNILFPTSLKVINQDEFKDIRQQFDRIGYCCFTPESATISTEKVIPSSARPEMEGMVAFETGILSQKQIEAIFSTLPVEITFIDKDDIVRYFSQPKEMIFARTKAIIGRQVQLCHPQKSVHLVNQILEDFKSSKRDVAEFWMNLEAKLVYIRYFAVRNNDRDYLGCLEVTQNITGIKKIEGEKRLL